MANGKEEALRCRFTICFLFTIRYSLFALTNMLEVSAIDLYYGAAQALRGVSLTAEPGKVTCLHEGTVLAEGTIDQVSSNERVIEVYLGR